MKEFKAILSEIENDNLSGSNTLADKLINILSTIATQLKSNDRQDIISGINSFVRKKPFFGSIRHLLLKLESNDNWAEALLEYKYVNEIASQSIAQQFKSLIKHGLKTFLLHSNSKTVDTAFRELFSVGPDFKIFQTESNPKKEGIIQGNRLKDTGFDVTIVEDDPSISILEQVDFLVTGADLILENEFINKTGTRLLALKILALRKSFIVLADQRKFASVKPNSVPATFEFIPRNLITTLISN